MRIIAGSKRGMKLLSPEGMDTRPITDRVKESMFNILANKGYLEDAVTADLFCGTGSMGLESLSRGAKWVTFIDKDYRVIDLLKKNIAKADFAGQCKPVSANILRVGAPPTPEYGLYDLVFVDPPYAMSENCDAGTKIHNLMLLIQEQVRDGALVILRTSDRVAVPEQFGRLVDIDRRTWGTMMVIFYCKRPHEADPPQQADGN